MILAFDIGGTRGRCGVSTADGQLLSVIGLERDGDDGARWLARLMEAGRSLYAAHPGAKAIGVSFGGPVSNDGRILSMHVSGWESINLVQELQSAFGLPVSIENDANAGALGEHRYGAGRGARYLAYLTVSTGIGGGVILDDRLYRGAHGMAAEFGHLVMHPGPNAPVYAASKPGALEALASGPAIAREANRLRVAAGLPEIEGLTARDVFDAADGKEKWAREALQTGIGHLARGVAAVLSAYDLERVVIGGGVSFAGDALFTPLCAAVKEYLPHFLEERLDLQPAALGDNSALLGAVVAALDRPS
jgi:glucokinase